MYLSYLQLVDIHTANTSLNMIQLVRRRLFQIAKKSCVFVTLPRLKLGLTLPNQLYEHKQVLNSARLL